ncbi:hypothetical protein [Aquihabitans sp. McL0605]|uniref:hypothetical protein n=1 Tax=Aquihabitans sp. McL0605 TaxID=3415671 RepID=UPI003CE8399C
MRATIAGLGALAAAILLSGCLQLQISPVLDRSATIRHGSLEHLTVTGTISCTRSEPVDLFPTFTQRSTTDEPESVNIPCEPGTPRPYTVRFEVTHGFVTGQIQASIQYCTNPSVELNEDCVTVSRVLTVTSP